ncbi:MAG: hypothetical protein K6G03_09775 [Lachnospiraceae bacterium]|nr:hypothetical protein [Lachnospiraceae bacterium]
MSKKRLYIFIAAIVLFAACLPLFTINCIGGHDINYHLLRIEALKEGILAGKPFLRINMLFFGGMGYASSLFYPDLLLYFPAILRALGVGINQSYHLFIALCIVLGFITSFYSARYISKSSYAGIITAVIFTLYQYHIDDIYTRSAVGEFTAVIFVPLVLAGLYDFIYEEFNKPWLLAVGMSGVLLCHTITTIVCLGVCVFVSLIEIRQLLRMPVKLLRLLFTIIFVMGLTAFYWMPVFEMLLTGTVNNEFTYNTAYESPKLWEIFYNDYNRMGVVIFVLLLSGLIIKRRSRFADICAVTGLAVTLCSTTFFPWARLEGVLGFVQFPWRLFVMSGPLLAFAEGIYFSQLASDIGTKDYDAKTKDAGVWDSCSARVILIIVTGIMLFSAISTLERNKEKYYSYSDDYFEYVPYTAEVIGGEWMPTTVENRGALISQADSARLDDGSGIGVIRNKNELEISGIKKQVKYADVPFVYYKGYAAVNSDTNEFLKVSAEGENGCIRVYTEGAENIRVYYKGTAIQHMSDIISLISLIAGISYIAINLRSYIREKKGKNEIGISSNIEG